MAFAQCYGLADRLARLDTKAMAVDANSFGSSRI
jgi:hypothetical protein